MKFTALFSTICAAAVLSAAEPVDLVSAKGTKATSWIAVNAPAAGKFTASVKLDGFDPVVSISTKEPRDPNAFFTDVPGIGAKIPVDTGLVSGDKGVEVKAGEKTLVRIVIPVGASATAGIVKGRFITVCGGKSEERELDLRVLDYVLPPAKSRYTGRVWTAHYGGALPSDWTSETPETYQRNVAKVSSVIGSLFNTVNDLQSERWRNLGVPYYALLDIPYVVNPDAWRRAAGVKAWLIGFDGVALPPQLKADPIVLAGLEDAAIDLAYLSYCSELSDALADRSKNPVKITYEGRLGQFWVDRVKPATDDMDVVRLETAARIMRLLAFKNRKEVAK